MEREEIVAAILQAAGGEVIGRVRLQKTAYLLDQLGLHSGFRYEYHHYGPYSRDLDNAVADAKAFDVAEEDVRHRQIDGATYSIFRLKRAAETEREAFGGIEPAEARRLAEVLADVNVTVLELAATVHWLCHYERRGDWRGEITRRKGLKVQNGRLEKAVALLEQLDLAPPEVAAA